MRAPLQDFQVYETPWFNSFSKLYNRFTGRRPKSFYAIKVSGFGSRIWICGEIADIMEEVNVNRKLFKYFMILALCGAFGTAGHSENASHLNSVKTLVSIGQGDAALAILQNLPIDGLAANDKALVLFSKGVLSYKAHQWEEAKQALLQTLEHKSQLGAYIHYFLGLTEKNLGNLNQASVHFNKALKEKPAREFRYEIKYSLGEIAMAKRQWRTAYDQYRYLQRRWKSSDNYPVVLRRLVEVDLKKNNRWRACRWARNLYRNFPSSQAARTWTIDLQNVEVDGHKLGCLATFNDQKRRIRRLQWAGESQQARNEIDVLIKRSRFGARYEVDVLLANFFVNEGFVKEALSVMLPYYNKKKNDFEYLMLIGKASARAGEFRTAVSAFYRAHLNQSRRSSNGKNALFKAAFLSYQFQDYDGAYRKFARFNKLYPQSGLTRDAQWHMAWIRYLKGDYDGAVTALTDVYRSARRHRWRWRKYPLDKIQYWLGMAYFRSNDHSRARDIFESLINDAPMGYYAQASRSRLEKLPEPPPSSIRGLASVDLNNTTDLTMNSDSVQLEDRSIVGSDDAESEDVVMADEAIKDDLAANEVPVDDASEVSVDDEEIRLFHSVKFKDQLDRALQLIQVGQYMWAKNELFEIEKRTRNTEHRKRLIKAYESILSYNRSSYMAEVYFSKERHSKGIKEAEDLWKHAYPEAFRNEVTHFSNQFGIEKEFVWGLMRAESRYKQDISSPVGAKGLMQLMPHTAMQVSRLLGDESFDPEMLVMPEVNIRLGTRYLQRLSKKFKGQLPLMAAGYNAGPHRVESWLATFGHLDMDEFIEHIPFVETRMYVKKVTRNYGVYRALYNGNMAPIAWLPESIHIPPGTRPVARETWEKL